MAVHKVPLDVEADDKFLGPLSFKQFLFAGGFLVFGYLTFLMLTRGLWPVAVIFFFPTFVAGIFAFPWSKEQPSELFLASRIRFFLKPRRRIWDQSGLKDLVNITVPKREVHAMTDGLDQTQVRNRFSALATMVDSRGWAVKNLPGQLNNDDSDRLVAPVAHEPLVVDDTQDIMDEEHSTIAKQFDSMIQQSATQQKSAAREIVENARKNAQPKTEQPEQQQDFWFMHQQDQPSAPGLATFPASPTITPGAATTATPTTPDPQQPVETTMTEEELLAKAKATQRRAKLQTGQKHGTIIGPDGGVKHEQAIEAPSAATTGTSGQSQSSTNPQNASSNDPATQSGTTASTQSASSSSQVYEDPTNGTTKPVTDQKDPAILELAQSNDLNVETLARQANKKDMDDGEVVISLH